jgi:pyruvate dehydrogenase complex dehydrogenase (E1) component
MTNQEIRERLKKHQHNVQMLAAFKDQAQKIKKPIVIRTKFTNGYKMQDEI